MSPLSLSGTTPTPPTGHLADNVVHFVRLLRATGIPVGPARALAALEAVSIVGVEHREDFRAALASVLISRQEQIALFDQAFELFWRNPRLVEKMLAATLPKVQALGGARAPDEEMPARLAQALARPSPPAQDSQATDRVELDAAFTFSPREVLRHQDFETMTTEELAEARRMLARVWLPFPELPTRRSRSAPSGSRVDLRLTMRRAIGGAGALAPLAWRARRRRTPPLVVLCDISGSMARYSRMLLHFLHAVVNDRDRVHVLLFGTRLTNVTRYLRHHDPDVALRGVAAAVSDWAGGTRIGACLEEFNKRWSRRLLAQNAIVMLISDGLDADAGSGLASQMQRLARSCRRLIWLNPLLRYGGFEARPAGIRAMLPYVDDFLPVHNLDSLTMLAESLARPGQWRRLDARWPARTPRRSFDSARDPLTR